METPTLIEILMQQENITATEACELIRDAQNELYMRLQQGENPFESHFCSKWLGVSDNYLIEVL